jgi:hypothetical protein
MDVGPLGQENVDDKAAATEEQPADTGPAPSEPDILLTVFPVDSQLVDLGGGVSGDEVQAGPSRSTNGEMGVETVPLDQVAQGGKGKQKAVEA